MAPDSSQGLTLRAAQWGAHAERWLSLALAGATLADLRRQVDAGASLFHICAGAEVVGAFLLRVDGDTGVIVASGGDLPGVDLTAACVPGIESLFRGVRRIRYHTARPGLVRKLARQGYVPREVICYKELK